MNERDWQRRICERVRELRRRTGLSQMQFANKADLSYHTVGKIERGQVFPTLETLIRFSESHQIPLAEFLGESAKASTRKEKAIRDLLSVLRGKDERQVDLAVGLIRYLFTRL